MLNIAIIFPNQLFTLNNIPYDTSIIKQFIIIEDPIYFSDKERVLRFNMLKLIYQRACMKYYESYLKENKLKVTYLNWESKPDFWYQYIANKFGSDIKLYFMDPTDHLLESRIEKFTKRYKFDYEIFETDMFLSGLDDLKEYHSNKKNFYQYNFYIWQRKRLNILMDEKTSKPIGGKYSFDKENRKPFPGKNFNQFIDDNKIKYVTKLYDNEFYAPAIKYCEKTFTNFYKKNYIPVEDASKSSSSIDLESKHSSLYKPDNIYLYPITHADTDSHFKSFVKLKLKYFAMYEDAMSTQNPYLFHSVISPQLNNGLITPNKIIKYILNCYHKSTQKKKILFAVEAYIRQLNWREYSRMLYVYAYDDMTKNYFNNDRKLNKSWYEGTTGILPVDTAIKEAFEFGYIHHILRLMVMCNFMNLCKVEPSQAYNWFMEFSLDSYDWIMINNVYSMGMFADGGLTTTKVYISSSTYITSQSDIKFDGIWNVAWKILYYYFIYRNYKKLTGRSTIYKSQWDRYENKNMIKREGKKLILKLTS